MTDFFMLDGSKVPSGSALTCDDSVSTEAIRMAGVHRSSPRRGQPGYRARGTALPLIPFVMALGAIIGLTVSNHMPGLGSSPTTTAASLTAASPDTTVADLAELHPRDPTGNPIDLQQTPAQAANSMNCTLIVPGHPLSAQGLATPWQLGDGCSEANQNLTAFVEATILAPDGHLSIYSPLVITAGTTPAVPPLPATIPAGAQVIIEIGFNGNNLVLEGPGAVQGNCIDAFGDSIIFQTSACGAQAFFQDANAQVAAGTLKIPALGTGNDGQTCLTAHSFAVIDQDQSDNVQSVYLANANGQTAQATAGNVDQMNGATILTNGSDEGLLTHFLDPAVGCKAFTATDPTSPGNADGSQALNELSARFRQQAPVALLPVNDPQLLVNGHFSIGKVNTYRMLTDQPPLPANTNTAKNAEEYCQEMVSVAPARLQLDLGMEVGVQSPVPALGNNLATFMGARLSASFMNLNCANFGLKNPVLLTLNSAGVAIAVTYITSPQQVHVPGRGGGPTPSPSPATPSPTPSATTPSPAPTPTPYPTISFGGF
jgi:hypothetical protein